MNNERLHPTAGFYTQSAIPQAIRFLFVDVRNDERRNIILEWTTSLEPALELYLCVCGDVHVTSNVELRNTSDCY